MENRLQESDLIELLHIRFSDKNVKFIRAEYKPISENTEGFMATHLYLFLTYERDGTEYTDKYFVKTKLMDKNSIHVEYNNAAFEKEVFLYDFLLKEFVKYGFDVSFAPKCYLCVGKHTIIMHDITDDGYVLQKRQTIYDVSKVKCLLKSLASYHAAGFAYEKRKSAEIGRPYSMYENHEDEFKEILFNHYISKTGFGYYWVNSCVKTVQLLIDLLPDDETYKNKFHDMIKKAEFAKIFVDDYGIKKICTHGDLWSNNMMFKTSGDVVESCCVYDFQVIRYFYPAFDVLLATHCNTDENFAKNHLEEMYQYYYDTLTEFLSKYGYSINGILPMDDYRKSLKICKPEAMLQAVGVNCLAFVPAEVLTEHMKLNFAKADSDEPLGTQLDKSMLEFSVTSFKNIEVYRKMLTKNLHDLYNALNDRLYNAN